MALKKLITVLLVIVLTVFVTGCGSSEEETAESETDQDKIATQADDQIVLERANEYYIDVDPGTTLKIRKTPGIGGAEDVVANLGRNEKVIVLDKHNNSVSENNYTWWEIVIPATQELGWVASDFLSSSILSEERTGEGSIETVVFNPNEYVGATRADFMNKFGYPDKIEFIGGIEFNHYSELSATVCYSRLINRSKIIKVKVHN